MRKPSLDTAVAKRIAEILHRAVGESNYPLEWNQWTDPISYYMFQATDGNIDAGQVGPIGAGWWVVNGTQLTEIETPEELLASHRDQGRLLIPKLNFLVKDNNILITETYMDFLCLRRRCTVSDLSVVRRIDELPVLWKYPRSEK